MAEFAKPPLLREQLVLFPVRLDQIVGPQHAVRLLDDLMQQIDWSRWEQQYDLTRGQPPIHPRVLASVILYGLLCRIRSSRSLEEAIEVRNDFRWLVEGRSIDHSTLSKFRQKNSAALKELFVQTGMVARQLGYLPLTTLAFDGTRLRANNRRHGTRTPAELKQLRDELETQFQELTAQIEAADAADDEQLGQRNRHTLADELADVNQRREQISAALLELAELEQAGQQAPQRLPITDPQSRILPNKEGGFAPNYTPLATVDVGSGLIVSADVIADSDEARHLLAAVADVAHSFQLDKPPGTLLADGLMATGENLVACAQQEIDLYSPLSRTSDADNPAIRENLTEPVASALVDQLPTRTTKRKDGSQITKFSKEAFVYDAAADCYWCPSGQPLKLAKATKDRTANGRRYTRFRYKSNPAACAQCPLAQRCLEQQGKQRQISHDEHESARQAHVRKMEQPAAQKIYATRRHAGERPFAVIKGHFGARRFLTRGLDCVRNEWLWLSSAFNLHRLMSLIRSGVSPPTWFKEYSSNLST